MDKVISLAFVIIIGWWVFKPDGRISGCEEGAEFAREYIEKATEKEVETNTYKYAVEQCKSSKFDNLQARLKENSNKPQEYINCEIGISFMVERSMDDKIINHLVKIGVADYAFAKCKEKYLKE